MIFRRSLVREMTATAIGLFLVLLAILFTNLVLRLLARAAGGAVAPDGVLALLGFNALFYFNILLSVTLFLTVLLTLSRWYRDSEMIVWFTSGQSLDRVPEADPAVRRAVPGRDRRCCRCSCRPGPSSASSSTSGSSSRATSSSLITPGLFREFRRAKLVVFVESINTFDGTIRNVFLHSIEDGKDATTVARSGRLEESPTATASSCSTTAGATRASRAPPSTASIEFEQLGRRIEPAEARALPTSTKAIPTAALLARRRPRSSAPSSSGGCRCRSRAGADAARDPARLRESADGPLVQPDRRGVPVHALQQLPQHRAELDRAGQARLLDRPRCCRTSIAVAIVAAAVPPPARRCSGGCAAAAAQRPDAGMKTLTRYIGREVLARDPADLRRAGHAVRVLRPHPRAGRRRPRRATRSARRCCSSRCSCRRACTSSSRSRR